MEPWQENRLDTYLQELVRCVDIEKTLLTLTVRNIFDINDNQLVRNQLVCRNDAEKRYKIIELLRSRGSDAYYVFCHTLELRAPSLYNLLHQNDIEMACPECTFPNVNHCYHCQGLLNVFSNPSNGIFIERTEDIVSYVENLKQGLASKENKIAQLFLETSKLSQQHHDLFARHVKDVENLSLKEKSLKEKEKEYEHLLKTKDTVQMEKEDVKIQKDKLQMEYDELSEKLTVIRKEPAYANNEAITEKLRDDIIQLQKINSNLRVELQQSNIESSRLKISKESLEHVLGRQKSENNRVFADLSDRHESIQEQYNKVAAEIDNLNEQLKVGKHEKEEIVKERDYLCNKLYEKNRALNESEISLNSADQELATLKRINRVQMNRTSQINASKEQLFDQYRIVVKERDGEITKSQELIRERDRLVLQLVEMQQQRDTKNVAEKSVEEIKQAMQKEVDMWKKKFLETTEVQPGDMAVVLRKFGESCKFGIRFAPSKGPLFLGESKIIVHGIDFDIPGGGTAPLQDVRVGDFVISINDVNVQNMEMDCVKSICQPNANSMKLVLRKPRQQQPMKYISSKLLKGECNNFEELGMTLGVYCHVRKSGLAVASGLQDLDELIAINNDECISPCINDLQEKILKSLKLNNTVLTLQRRIWNDSRKASLSSESKDGRRPYKPRNHSLKATEHSDYETKNYDDDTISFESGSTNVFEPVGRKESLKLENQPPQPLPRSPRASSTLARENSTSSASSQNLFLEYSMDKGPYSYVEVHALDLERKLRREENQESNHYKNNTVTIKVKKEAHESVGLVMIGGNKTGIFVHEVENWKPAEKAGVKKGYRILKMNDLSMVNVAFCYAFEALQRCSKSENVTFLFEPVPLDHFEEILKKTPYDSFHVRALLPYQARLPCEISFAKHDVMCVTNSYCLIEPGKPYQWRAYKEVAGTQVSGLVPRQISSLCPSAIADHHYAEIEQGQTASERNDNLRGDMYVILEPVGEVLV